MPPHRHNSIISERPLKLVLKSRGLFGCRSYTSLAQVTTFIKIIQ